MGVIWVLYSALAGFIAGYFLQVIPLQWCTGIVSVVTWYMLWTTRKSGLGGIIGVLAVLYGFIGIATAWGTYFFSTGVHLSVFDFLQENIFRVH